jgi:hypothetical protein
MKKLLLLLATVLVSASTVSAQVIHQWNFNDTAGTALNAAVDSVGTLLFNSSTTNPGNWTTNGSGQLTGGAGAIGNADIVDVSSGIYQMDLTGVTFTGLSGGTDDWGVFGLRSFSSTNITGFGSQGSSSSNQAIIVFGNEDGTSGLDVQIINTNSNTLVNNLTADFTGTFDFRVVIDLDNDTADYFWQRNGGGYSTIVSQQANSSTITALALGGGTFSDTISINQTTWAAVPEPSSAALLILGGLGLLVARRRLQHSGR